MMFIDLTSHLAPLIAGMNVLLLVAASSVFAAAWRSRKTAGISPRIAAHRTRHVAIVDTAPSAPAVAGEAPSDTSVAEAA